MTKYTHHGCLINGYCVGHIRFTFSLLAQFEYQDVMVPWHLQPKYTPKGDSSSTAKRSWETKEEKESKTRSKRERRKKKRMKELVEERLPIKEKSSVENAGERLMGPLREMQLDDEDLCPCRPTAVKNPGTDGRNVRENLQLGQELGPGQEQEQAGELGQKPPDVGQEERLEQPGQRQALKVLGYSTYQRYYHVFRQGELALLVQDVPGVEVKQEYYDHENWCVVAVKTEDSNSNLGDISP